MEGKTIADTPTPILNSPPMTSPAAITMTKVRTVNCGSAKTTIAVAMTISPPMISRTRQNREAFTSSFAKR